MSPNILQSLMAFNAEQIDTANMFYQSYKDMQKNAKSKDEYERRKKAAQKELKRMKLLERNQKALAEELKWIQRIENYVSSSESGWEGWIE